MERLTALLGWLVALGGCLHVPTTPIPSATVPTEVLEEAREGDLIFRRGQDLMSRMVLAGEAGSHFSHVGLLVWQDSMWMVLHALPDEGPAAGGVRLEPLTTFITPDKAAAWAVYGHPEVRALAGSVAVEDYVGLPFDAAFVWSDASRLYCTELVVRAWSGMGVEVADELSFLTAPLLAEPVLAPDALLHLEGLLLVHREE